MARDKALKKDYVRTSQKHTSRCGTKRTIYTKNGSEYIKRLSKKTGKMRFVKVSRS